MHPANPSLRIPPRGTTATQLGLAAGLLLGVTVHGDPPRFRDQGDEAATLAWVRLNDGAERYEGTPYHWLAQGALQIVFEVAPQTGQALELQWGAKGDERTARVVFNGQNLDLSGGGYRGFRWLRVPLPEAAPGPRQTVRLEPRGTYAAFLAEVRLVGPKPLSPPPDLGPASHRARVERQPTSVVAAGEAFPALRRVWDREPEPAVADRWFRQAERNGRQAHEAFYRSRRYVDGWLAQADPTTGLIPENLKQGRDTWNGRNAAADNYPFMVLTAALTDRPLMEGRLLDMLHTERRLTARVDRLADDYSFSRQGWRRERLDLDATIFDSAEYVKDGLIPLTEWLGRSPWSDRMIELVDDIWKNAPIDTPFGRIPTLVFEVNGDLLQSCARLFWFTGERRYLDWALRLGDYYLLGTNHPTRDLKELRLRDHGGEVVNGLTELYVAVKHRQPDKAAAYRAPLHALFDRILEVGRNEHGMLYDRFDPRTGAVLSRQLCDTWGYVYDGFYTLYLLDGTEAYRGAVRTALGSLNDHYRSHRWESSVMDGYADSVEGAINLHAREPLDSTAAWIDSEIRIMWGQQQPDGVIEGWHGDGNFARTSIMYALWKTQGITVQPWRADVQWGAARDDQGRVCLRVVADTPWEGRVVFDRPRHKDHLHLPLDYPRINQFAEWFTAEADQAYAVTPRPGTSPTRHRGRDLIAGLPLRLQAGETAQWIIEPARE